LADGISDAAALVFVERKRPEAQQSPESIDRQLGKVRLGLQTMNSDLGEHEWCVNGSFSLADIAVGCTLGYLDFRFTDEIDWRRNCANLAELYDRLIQRASFRETMPVA
jgi:glutathione S-transferase